MRLSSPFFLFIFVCFCSHSSLQGSTEMVRDTTVQRIKMAKEGTIEGTFVKLERGDFLHVSIKDSLGKIHSYFLYLDNDKLMDKYWKGYSPKRKQKLRVQWKRQMIQLAGSYYKFLAYTAISVEELEKK